MERSCPNCGEVLAEEMFGPRIRKSYKGKIYTSLRKYCRKCRYKIERHDIKPEDVRRRRLARKLRAIELLGGKCVKCGYNKNPYVLDFNHKEGHIKEFSPSRIIQKRAWDLVVKELAKCELLCANCHREYTFREYYTEG